LEENYAVEKFLSSLTLKKIAPDVLDVYRKPYQDKKARLVLWQALLDNPLFNSKSPMIPMINDYIQWLKVTQIRKLLVYAVPGFLVSMDTVKWCIDNFSELTTVDIGFGLHYLPETLSDEISDAIFNWIA
jgi:haloalkane dehalogenase